MRTFNVTVNGQTYEVSVEEVTGGAAPARAAAPAAPKAAPKAATKAAPKAVAGAGTPIKAPMPGTILDVKVKVGDTVKNGQAVCVLEAMKMENEITASRAGTITAIHVAKVDSILEGAPIVTIA